METNNTRLNKSFLGLLALFHIFAIWAVFYFFWELFANGNFHWGLPLLAYVVRKFSHGVGLAVGYHRLLTHRGFKTPLLLEWIITICGLLTLQGGHIKWIATHRYHHKYTEQEEDPHSPRKGFFHSYIGWMVNTKVYFETDEFLQKYAPDLYKKRFHYWLNKFWWAPTVVFAVILYFVSGFAAVGWGVLIPVTWGLHWTWHVNSTCHRFGSRQFETNDDSTNNLIVAVMTYGEGWHNNHHDSPVRARHGLKWYQYDFGWQFISMLRRFGLASDIKL